MEVSLYTGTATHRIPIDVLPGIVGLAPSLALVYSNTEGNGWMGPGWGLEGISYIEAIGPEARGGGTLEPQYRLVFGGRSYRLINAGVDPSGAASPQYWRTEQESFLRIWKDAGADGGWIITGTNGTTYQFGLNHSDSTPSILGKWGGGWGRMYLTIVKDSHGNEIRYDYDWHPADSQNFTSDAYLQLISYPGGTVKFNWQDRADPYALSVPTPNLSTGGMNTGITVTRRLASIEVGFGAGNLIRRYELGYTDSPTTPLRHSPVSQLTSVTVKGADGTTALPPTTFTYKAPATTPSMAATAMTGAPAEPLGQTAGGVCARQVDWNRDGLPDVVIGYAGGYRVYLKNADDSFRAWSPIDTSSGTLWSLCSFKDEMRMFVVEIGRGRNRGAELIVAPASYDPEGKLSVMAPASPIHNTEIVDLDGDSLPDLLHSTGTGPAGTTPGVSGTWSWRKNLGNDTFGPEQAIVNPPPLGWLDDVNVHLVDMNGDGLLDFVWYSLDWTGNPDQYHYRLNWWANVGPNASGNLEFRNPASFTPCGLPRPASGCQDLAVLTVPMSFSGHITRLIDMNGDGFLDFAHVARYPGGTIGIPQWRYLPGAVDSTTGQIYFRPAVVMLNPTPIPEYLITYDIYLADVNGDGLPDLLRGVEGQSPVFQPNIRGLMFGSPIPLAGAPDIYGPNQRKSIRFGDMNSDGFLDILRGNAGDYTYWSWTPNPVLNHRLLDTVKSPLGGGEILDYRRERIGQGGVGWAVNQLSRDAADGQLMSMTNYTYAGGLVASWPWNEFRGFATVTVTEPPDHGNQRHRTITHFHQDDARKGRVDFTETVRASDGAIFAREKFSYAAGPTLPGVMRVDLVGHQRQIWDGTASATNPNSATGTSTFSDNFDNYGQAREVSTYSLWIDNSGSAPIGSIATHIVTTDFVYNTGAYIVNKPSRTQTTVGGAKTSETWFDYDGLANGAAPTKGDLTRETRWLSGGANPVVQHFYDNQGRRIGTIDPKGNVCASTGYTTAFEYSGVYVIKETNALCQAITMTYWDVNTTLTPITGSAAVPGLLATVTDVNGVRTDSYFDALGRPKAAVLPPDTAAAPTTVWSYRVTGTAPSSTTVQKRESVGGGTLDSVTYADGLGRAIQTKSEAETAGQWLTVDTRYNPRGLAESVSAPYTTATSVYTAADTSKPKATTLYDPIRRPIEVWNPDGTVRRTAYTLGVVTTTDEKNNQTLRTMDVLGRLIKVRESSSGGDTLYSYDTFDASGNNNQTIADALNNVTTTIFDTLGRKVSQIDPDLGTWNYIYDANGNLLTQRDAKNQTLIFAYDKLNRVTKKITSPADNTPPILSSIASGNINNTGATISWTTDEVSDSQVEYGTSTTYGSSTLVDSSLVVSHGVVLSGLSSSTLYHYRVKSKDALGNLRTSGDFTFTTSGTADTTPPSAPSSLTATMVGGNQIDLTWTASTDNVGVSRYEVERKSNNGQYVVISSPTINNFTDNGVSGSTTYLYRVRAFDAAGNASVYGNIDLATTILFTDDPLVAGAAGTFVQAAHLTELRQAVNAVRAAAGLAAAAWTDATLIGIFIKAVHIQELRDHLAPALAALGLTAPSYTDPILTAGSTVVKKAHLEELRQAVE